MQPLDFIETARDLAGASRQVRQPRETPRETNLRRAVSTTYYALFHCLASCCADTIAGDSPANRDPSAWNQAYRALNHGTVKSRCEDKGKNKDKDKNNSKSKSGIERFPSEIRKFAEQFVRLQMKRHRADYDPDANFSQNEVIHDIEVAENVIRYFTKTSLRDRRAFVAYVLLPIRERNR